MLLFQKMIVLFLMMLVGYTLYKKQILNEESCKAISSIVINVANPALVISSTFEGAGSIKGEELLLTFAIAIMTYAFLIGISFIIPRVLRAERSHYGILKSMIIFSNIGFMGFPIISSVYGSSALLYASIFLLPYNILIYTYGIWLMRKESSTKNKIEFGQIFNIGVLTCIAAVLLYVSKITLPDFAKSTTVYLSNLTAPLSMIIIGTSLAKINVKDIIKDIQLIFFSIIKLFIIPVIGCGILQFFVKNEIMFGVCIVMLATPVGSMTSMLAQQYGGDHEFASKYIVVTTLLSVITIPVVFSIFH